MSSERTPQMRRKPQFKAFARTAAILSVLPVATVIGCTENQQTAQEGYSPETIAGLHAYYRDLKALGLANNYEGGLLTIYFETGAGQDKPVFLVEQTGQPAKLADSSRVLAGLDKKAAIFLPFITRDCSPITVSVVDPDGKFKPLRVVGSQGENRENIVLDQLTPEDTDTCIGVYTLQDNTLSSIQGNNAQ